MKLEFKWELILQKTNEHSTLTTARAKVHGGWLIMSRQVFNDNKNTQHIAMNTIFIDDKKHEWKVEEE